MTMASRRWQDILLFLTVFSVALAKTHTSFCKCTCFNYNSTIITLSAPGSSNSDNTTSKTGTCTDCTKKFCLESNLSGCDEAAEDDVSTYCFQRESTKDEVIILIFIFATVGLLAWAAFKPWIQQWRDRSRATHTYAPVGGGRESVDGQ